MDDDKIVGGIRKALEKHNEGLKNLESLWPKYEALIHRLGSRDRVKISKENSSGIKFSRGSITLVNAGFDISIELSRGDAMKLAGQIISDSGAK